MKLAQILVIAFLFLCFESFLFAYDNRDAADKIANTNNNTTNLGFATRAGFWGGFFGIGAEGVYGVLPNLFVIPAYSVAIPFGEPMPKDRDTTSTNARLTTLKARYLVGPIFSVTTGVGFKQVKVELHSKHVDMSEEKGSYEIDSFVVTVDLGHTWQFNDRFFFGVDWLGFMYSLNDKITDKSVIYDTASPDGRKDNWGNTSDGKRLSNRFAIQSTAYIGILL